MVAPRPDDEFADDEAIPDSAVRPIPTPISVPISGRATTVGRIPGMRASSTPPAGERAVRLVIRATEALRSGYLTVSGADSCVLFEGELGQGGLLVLDLTIPATTKQLRALLETATKYRNAIIDLSDGEVTEHLFA